MKAEAWIFGACAAFFVLVTPAYWFIAGDPTGTAALVMTTLLAALVAFYLGFHASKMEPRPEDRADGEIADGDVQRQHTRRRRRATQHRPHPQRQFTRAERLGQIVVGAGLQTVHTVFHAATRSQHQDRRVDPLAADAPAKIEAVPAGQHDVEDDDVRSPAPEAADRGGTVDGDEHLVALGPQPDGDGLRDGRVVVDHEHPAGAVERRTHGDDSRHRAW